MQIGKPPSEGKSRTVETAYHGAFRNVGFVALRCCQATSNTVDLSSPWYTFEDLNQGIAFEVEALEHASRISNDNTLALPWFCSDGQYLDTKFSQATSLRFRQQAHHNPASSVHGSPWRRLLTFRLFLSAAPVEPRSTRFRSNCISR